MSAASALLPQPIVAAVRGRGDAGAPAVTSAGIERHLPLVRHVARQLLGTLAPHVEMDDLVGAGTIGLMKALESFEPERGHAFSTYAALRIRGAMLDELRRMSDVSRSVRRRRRSITSAEHQLAASLHRRATSSEVASRMGIGEDVLHDWRRAGAAGPPLSLETALDTDGAPLADVTPASSLEDIEHDLWRGALLRRVQRELSTLRERDRKVLALYYHRGLTLREIGEVLGLTESRVSQLHTQIIARLRQRLGSD